MAGFIFGSGTIYSHLFLNLDWHQCRVADLHVEELVHLAALGRAGGCLLGIPLWSEASLSFNQRIDEALVGFAQ